MGRSERGIRVGNIPMIAVVEIQETRQGLVRVSGRMLSRPKEGYKKTSR
jgi:hypothetical protein